jgi:hypothetical protein
VYRLDSGAQSMCLQQSRGMISPCSWSMGKSVIFMANSFNYS